MKLPSVIFKHTNHFFNDICRSEILFIISLFCFPFFLFLKNLILIWNIVGFFCILTLLRRGKVKILPSVIITLGIVFFALLTPSGKVIYSFNNIKITDGSLNLGLHRSGILIGMLFISQFSVSSNLHFPGKIGLFFSQMFIYFDKLSEKNISFKPNKIISSIDERLIEIWENINV